MIFFYLISRLYKILIWLRNLLYDKKWVKIFSFEKPIISIGNLSTGGTGKTPLVIYLSEYLKKIGKKPGIISRGYGRSSTGLKIVHDGKNLLIDVHDAGDEPFLIAKILNNVPIIVSENKSLGIKHLIDLYNIDVIIMDDGFQHRKVDRNLDIVTISSNDDQSHYRHLPLGKLREPLKNIDRSNIVLYTKTNNYEFPEVHSKIKNFFSGKYFSAIHKETIMIYDSTGYHKSLTPNDKLFAFCGIADPKSFFNSLSSLELKLGGKRVFKDHQNYTTNILDHLSAQINASGCKSIITTEKDWVKLPEYFLYKFKIYIIKIEIKVEKEKELISMVQKIFM